MSVLCLLACISSWYNLVLKVIAGLQLTAQVEYQMVTSSTELSQTALRLQSASQEATAAPEDVFQARVCLGWLHWTLNRPELALRTIPQDVFRAYKELDHEDRRSSAWSNICAIKGVYLRGEEIPLLFRTCQGY